VSLHSAAAGAERVIELLDEPVAVVDKPEGLEPTMVRGELRFENVGFAYETGGPRALDGVSFGARPGTVTAIVGPNGAGKSTLVRLMLRLHDPVDGVVTFDGHDLRDLGLAWFHRQVAVVLQEALVVDGTIRENILFGNPDATEEELVRAATLAGVDTFVADLADGYDTLVGERGTRLSGGQRQRIALARALVTNAPIIILDEPTTHLDTAAAAALADAVAAMSPSRTVIVITHDTEVSKAADEVFVVNAGRIVERRYQSRRFVTPSVVPA
jgi:ATP-binding cassette, subfamily B, bacterial